MKRQYKFLVMLILAIGVLGMLPACGKDAKKNESNPDTVTVSPTAEPTITSEPTPTAEPSPTSEPTPTISVDDLSTEEIELSKLPIKLTVPKAAVRKETEDSFYAETDEYLLYAFGSDTYNDGIILDEIDIASMLSNEDKRIELPNILRLKKAVPTEESEVKLYSNVNGAGAVSCLLSEVELDNAEGKKVSGSGSLMVYGAQEVGIYVIVGVLKDTAAASDRAESIQSMLQDCVRSVQQTGKLRADCYIWDETMPDGTSVVAVFKNGVISEVEEVEDGFRLYFNEDKTGFYLIQHWNKYPGISTGDEYLEDLKRKIGEDNVSYSKISGARGMMLYRRMKVISTEGDAKYVDDVLVHLGEDGSLWLVDVCGTSKDVSDQAENLVTLLWSLHKR